MAEIVEFVERALVDPVADLQQQARKGYASDKLVYGLALKAGRAGAGQEKNARKWIKKAANSFDRPTPTQPTPNVTGPAAQPARNLEVKSYSQGVAVPSISTGREPSQSYIGPSYPNSMNPDTILIAEACVDALLMAPNPKANVFACGGEAEYRRLLELMPK
jgi:hypothetical protein